MYKNEKKHYEFTKLLWLTCLYYISDLTHNGKIIIFAAGATDHNCTAQLRHGKRLCGNCLYKVSHFGRM